MKRIAIIGAGITGLTAAFYLKRKNFSLTIFEAANRAGGVIQSKLQNGFLAEFGPNTISETSPKISQLVRDLNLESRRIFPNPKAKKRFLVRDKKLVAMPGSPFGFLTTKLFSAKTKFAFLREPFISRNDDADESVAAFILRRLNREFLERAIDPLIAGIYAGDAEKLSVKHAFPRLKNLETKYGSLLKGQIFGARDREKSGEVSRQNAKMFSFDAGLQVLTDALAAQIGDGLKLNSHVEKISQIENGWRISSASGEDNFDAVIFCGTAHRLAELKIEAQNISDFSIFSKIRYAPVASVTLGFRRGDVAHPLDGFGMLIPKIENCKILGTIFSSSLFPNRAPENFVTLTSYIGGERQPELAFLPPEKLVEVVGADLRVLLGVRGEPRFEQITIFPQAIPQYTVGFEKFKNAFAEIENKNAGLFFAGNYRDGISLGDSIVAGSNIAERVKFF